MKRNVVFLVVLVGVFLLSGCTRYENYAAGTVLDINDPGAGVVALENVSVATPIDDGPEITEYIIGSGDVISVYVPGMVAVSYTHLTLPTTPYV